MANENKAVISKTKFVEQMGSTDLSNFAQIGALVAAAKHVDYKELQVVSGAYLELKDKETHVFFCIGMTDIEPLADTRAEKLNERGMCDAVELIDENGNNFVNADVVMVSTVKKLTARGMIPCMIHVFVNGTKGAKGKEYKNLEIRVF